MRRFGTVVAALLVAASAFAAQAAEIKVLSTPTLKSSFGELTAQFERESGHKLALRFEGVPVLKRLIEGGEPFDIAILLPADIDDLIGKGKIGAGARTDIARTAAGIAIRAGAAKPNVGSVEDVKRTLLAAGSISYSPESASGTYFLSLLGRLGLDAAVQPKLVPVTGRSPVDAVARGEADLTVITVPNIVGVSGVELGGVLPTELQNYTTFSAGLSASTMQKKAAEELVKFLRTPTAIAVFRSKGLEPVAP